MTEPILWALRVAGVLQLVVALANRRVVTILDYAGNLQGTTLIFRHVFWGMFTWVLLTVIAFGLADLAFARALAGAAPIGRALSATLAALWGLRLGLQLFRYDPEVRRQHRAADAAFTLFFAFVCAVHATAAIVAPLAGAA